MEHVVPISRDEASIAEGGRAPAMPFTPETGGCFPPSPPGAGQVLLGLVEGLLKFLGG